MDPQKLLTLDRRVVASIRLSGLVTSLVTALLCLLVFTQIITLPETYYSWACLPLAGAMVITGVTQAFWGPYTLRKIMFWSWIYVGLGGLVSTLVLGFSSFVFLAWLLLISSMGIYLRARGALLGYLAMLVSLGVWIGLHSDLQASDHIGNLTASALAVGIVVYIALHMLRLTNTMVSNLDASNAKEDLEHGQLTSLINSMADGVIAVDEQAKVILYNAAALNILDLNTSMQGGEISRFIKPLTKENASIDMTNLVQNTRTPTTNRDLRIKYQDGSYANLYLAITPVHLGYGKSGQRGFVLLLRDITREKSLEEERDEFISVVSHELRTPIAISEGNISNAQLIVEKSGDPALIKKALEEAHSQVIFLAEMINDLATLSRAERGKLTLELADIDVKKFMGELMDAYTADANRKGLKFSATSDPALTTLTSSVLYVREILQNFVTNAIKYTDSGNITLSARPQNDGVLFEVTDTGIGISKADQERVFDKFFRSEDFRTRQHNGTGLGLYVTAKLANLIHATIDLSSELNKGSTFSIFVPNLKK